MTTSFLQALLTIPSPDLQERAHSNISVEWLSVTGAWKKQKKTGSQWGRPGHYPKLPRDPEGGTKQIISRSQGTNNQLHVSPLSTSCHVLQPCRTFSLLRTPPVLISGPLHRLLPLPRARFHPFSLTIFFFKKKKKTALLRSNLDSINHIHLKSILC